MWGPGLSSSVAPRQHRHDGEAFPSLGGAAGAREEEAWGGAGDPDNPNVPSFRQAMLTGWGHTGTVAAAAAAAAAGGGGGGGKRKNKRGTVLFTVG